MNKPGTEIEQVDRALQALLSYLRKQEFRGYDPYDSLLSPIPFHWLGKWGPVLITQFQKRNPFNIRPLIGISKGYNPKAMGLFLHAYTILYRRTGEPEYLEQAQHLFHWLNDNANHSFPGASWGYNFPWAGPKKFLPAYTPTAVVTGFVVRGIHAFYELTHEPAAAHLIHEAADFILHALPRYEDESGISFSYSPIERDVCYNASLLAAEVLARDAAINGNEECHSLIERALSFVISRQHSDGRWDYSEDTETGLVRVQTDFHQGYLLESLFDIPGLIGLKDSGLDTAIEKGLSFYRKEQFGPDGRSFFRLPRAYPTDIHNQSQGIITFARIRQAEADYLDFAQRIANYTLQHMQRGDGAFIYKKYPWFSHRISYIRWSQAWMLLALATLLEHKS
jgi:hypothetical protein